MYGLHHRILFRLIEAAQPVSIPTRACLQAKLSGLPREPRCEAIRAGRKRFVRAWLFVFFMHIWRRYKQASPFVYSFLEEY